MTLTEELKAYLHSCGADLVGIADLGDVAGCAYPLGVSVALALPKSLVQDLQTAPTREYNEIYHAYNQKLNEIVKAGEQFLRERGFEAYAQSTDRVQVGENRRSPLPHKTVATKAGLGWIGKNCLLVTFPYGCAVRLSSLLTKAPLEADEPVLRSYCGSCQSCVEGCPAQALRGSLWTPGLPREEIVDVESCYRKQLEIMLAHTSIETDLCGKCFALCPYTKKDLEKEA